MRKLTGGANYHLHRMILFDMVKRLEEDTCYRCKQKIISIKEFSIEHKKPWRKARFPLKVFYDIKNIAFSHRLCNYKAAVRVKKYPSIEIMLSEKRKRYRASESWRQSLTKYREKRKHLAKIKRSLKSNNI